MAGCTGAAIGLGPVWGGLSGIGGGGTPLGACRGVAMTGVGPAWLDGAWTIGARGPQGVPSSESRLTACETCDGGLVRAVAVGKGALECSTMGSVSTKGGA